MGEGVLEVGSALTQGLTQRLVLAVEELFSFLLECNQDGIEGNDGLLPLCGHLFEKLAQRRILMGDHLRLLFAERDEERFQRDVDVGNTPVEPGGDFVDGLAYGPVLTVEDSFALGLHGGQDRIEGDGAVAALDGDFAQGVAQGLGLAFGELSAEGVQGLGDRGQGDFVVGEGGAERPFLGLGEPVGFGAQGLDDRLQRAVIVGEGVLEVGSALTQGLTQRLVLAGQQLLPLGTHGGQNRLHPVVAGGGGGGGQSAQGVAQGPGLMVGQLHALPVDGFQERFQQLCRIDGVFRQGLLDTGQAGLQAGQLFRIDLRPGRHGRSRDHHRRCRRPQLVQIQPDGGDQGEDHPADGVFDHGGCDVFGHALPGCCLRLPGTVRIVWLWLPCRPQSPMIHEGAASS